MKIHDAFPTLVRNLPEPARALRLARLLIPLCLFVGIIAEPLFRWALHAAHTLSFPFSL